MSCSILCRLFIASLLCAGLAAAEAPAIAIPAARVWFSPNGGCTEAIDGAQRQILVQAYSFTSNPIAKALVEAKRRGIDVRVILDKSQRTEKYSGADFVAHGGIPVLIDEKPAIAHSKVMIIDTARVITGSFNFTSSAEGRNVENVLQLDAPELAQRYIANWQERAAVSVPYVARDQR
jgi:phosphatidylserine/phosphatidylglycerophosphate/cardiolipin synthase-like enzyme